MALGKEKDRELSAAFHDFRELRVEVAYPFFLVLYHDYISPRLIGSRMMMNSKEN